MGNINGNFEEINIENLTKPTKNDLQILNEDQKLYREAIKNAKQNMKYISKHNKDMKDSDLIEGALLGHYYLFSLSKQARAEIVQRMSQYLIKENNYVFKKGDYPTYYYILKEGNCEMFVDEEKKTFGGGHFLMINLCYIIVEENVVLRH